MAKTVSLNEFTYSKLAALSGELTAMVRKPISLGMTVHLALIIFEDTMTKPKVRKMLITRLQEKVRVSPEKFDETWDLLYKSITKGKS